MVWHRGQTFGRHRGQTLALVFLEAGGRLPPLTKDMMKFNFSGSVTRNWPTFCKAAKCTERPMFRGRRLENQGYLRDAKVPLVNKRALAESVSPGADKIRVWKLSGLFSVRWYKYPPEGGIGDDWSFWAKLPRSQTFPRREIQLCRLREAVAQVPLHNPETPNFMI